MFQGGGIVNKRKSGKAKVSKANVDYDSASIGEDIGLGAVSGLVSSTSLARFFSSALPGSGDKRCPIMKPGPLLTTHAWHEVYNRT